MPGFDELVKNLYTSKDRELTQEKLDYINKTYKGNEQEFIKNFYATIGEDLTEEKLNYISDTYLKQPKAVQPPAKKKSLESRSAWEGIMSSVVPSVKPTQQPAASSSVKKAEIPQAVDVVQLNSEIKRDKTKDGLYTFPDQETAVYKKQNGQWLVDVNKSGNFQPLTKGDVEARSKNLDERAIPLSTTQGPNYEERVTYLAKEKAKEKLPATATEEEFNKEVSKNELIEKQKRLKELGYDVEPNGDATDKKTIDAFNKYSQYVAFKKESDTKRGAFMQKVDKSLDLNLINQTEESAVETLRKNFGKDGFLFDETGAGDAITVRYSIDGMDYSDPITIDLQTFNSNPEELNKLKSFIKNKYVSGAEKDVILNQSKNKLGEAEDNDAYERRYYKETIKLLAQSPSRFGEKLIDEGQYNNYMDSQYEDLRGITNDIKDFEFNIKKQVEDFNLNPTKEKEISINNNINKLTVLKNNVKKSTEDLVSMEKNYYKALGKWSEAKEKQGNFFGSLAASVASGFTSGEKALMNVATDLIVSFAPNAGMSESEYRRLIDLGYTDQEIKSKASSEIKRTIVKDVSEGITNIASLGSTTDEYIKSKDRSFLENVATGLAESIGASVSGGGNKTMQGLAFFAQSYNTMQDQMSGKEFDGMSVWEKSALSSIYGIAIGQLEKLGFDQASNITKNSLVDKLIKNTIAKTLPNLPKNASMPAIEEAISQSLGKTLATSGIRITAGGLSEGGVEGIQSITEDGFKYLVNEIHDKKLFQDVPDLSTKDGWKKSLGAAVEDAAAGAVGGMIMSSYDSFTTKVGEGVSDSRFELMRQSLMNETTLKAVQMKAKMELENGTINQEQYDKKIEGINNTVSTLEKIPEGYTVREKRKAFELINQKNVIEKGIEGKDPLLVTKEKKQIAEIDAQLVALSEAERVKEEPIDIIADLREDFDAELENNGISPEMVEMNNELNKKENATKEGNITESNLTERENGNESGKTTETGGSNSTVESGENQKEVEQLRADERAELAEAIKNIDDYKVDGEIDKSLMDKSTLAKYQEIYDKYDKLITPLLPKKEVVQKEEDVLVPTEELDILKEDIEKRKDEGSLGINLGEKVFMGDTPGMIRIDPENENTIVFETNDKIIVLGNVDEVGDSDIASFGLSLFPPTGTLVTGDTNAITYNGKNYKIIGRRRDKKGKAVVRVKDLDTGLEKRIIGQDAENILKDYALSKEKKVQPLKLSVEQKETPVAKKSQKAKKENPVNVDSTLEELAKEEERLRQEAIDFENSLAEDISKESKKESNLIFSVKGNEFSVTLKSDGTFSVSQKNDKGKFVGIKDQAKRDLAINEYKKIKNDKDTSRLKDAEELSSMFKKEQEDKILDLLNKAIKATSSNGRAFDATLGVPIFVANTALKIVKEAYLINKNILESIKKGYDFISKNYNVSEYDFKKFVYDNINAPTEETKKEKEVKSPSAKKILGIKDKKVTVNERVSLNDQLRLEAKAAREASKNIKDQQKFLTAVVKNLAKSGKITASQSANLLRRLAYLNVNNPKTVDEFLSYAKRLFANAEYSDKVDKGFKAKAKIKAKLKSKNQAPVTQVAKDFATIDPSLVTDIDKYNEMADAILAAIAPSVSGVKKNEEGEYEANNKLKTPIVIADVQAYVEKALKAQKEIERQRLLSYYNELVEAGILNDKMSIEEIREVVANENNDDDKLTAKERAKIVMDDLKERFEVAKSAIEDILDTDDTISKADREIIQRLMSLDLTDMKIKDAMALVDAANNFITNGITAGLQGELPKHEGRVIAKKLKESGLVAKSIGFLRGFGTKMKTVGSIYATQVLHPNMLANTLFGAKGPEVMRMIGFDKLYSGVAKATIQAKKKLTDYSKEFSKTRPNGKRFTSPFNRYERGIYASLLRSPIGTEFEQKQAFKKAIDEVFLSTKKLLESGDSAKIRKGKVYQEIIDKLGLANDDVSIESVQAKVATENIDAVDFWVQTWNEYYGELYDLSLGVYNTKLDKELNYTPSRKSKLDLALKEEDLLNDAGSFASFLNLGVDNKKAGVLMEANKKLSGANRYQDYDFDGNNKEGFEAALMDIYTAEAIRQIEGVINSDDMKSVIPVADTRSRFNEKLKRYINIKKGRSEFQDKDIKNVERIAAAISKFVTGRTLGTITAIPAQFVAPALNTFINTGRLDFRDMFSPDARAWMDKEGVSVRMRGLENFDSITRHNEKSVMDALEKSGTVDAALNAIEKYFDFWLKNGLVVSDRAVGTVSWFSYYKKSLKQQGLSTNIDWKNHKKNDKAFAYANSMIDKNQNASDSDLTGNIYSSKKAGVRIARNIVAPFSSFTMNSKARMHADLLNMFNWKSDGAKLSVDSFRSLIAGLAEVVAFNTLQKGIKAFVLYEIASLLFGGDEDDEEYKKLKAQYIEEGQSSAIKDVFSLNPVTDYWTIKGANYFIEQATERELTEDKIKDAYEKDKESRILKGSKEISYDDFKKEYVKTQVEENMLYNPSEEMGGGVYANIVKMSQQMSDMYNLAYNKKIRIKKPDGEYTEKVVTDEVAEAGKKAFYLTLAHQAGALPGEASTISKMILKKAKATAVTPNVKKVADDFKKDLGLKELTQYQKDMIKSGANLESVIENEWFITKAGGLNTKQKQDDFKKIKDVFGSNLHVYNIVTDINKGISASQIIKKNKEQLLDIQSKIEKIQPKIEKAEADVKERMIKDIKNSRK